MTQITCGIYLFSKPLNKIVVCHATNSRWIQWSIPKGLAENGEDYFIAAARELKEETGIDLEDFDYKKHSLPSVKYQKQNKILESFLIITEEDFSAHKFKSNLVEGKNFAEVDSWKWVALDEAEIIVHETQKQNLGHIKKLV